MKLLVFYYDHQQYIIYPCIKFIHEFWFTNNDSKGAKVGVALKILIISYSLTVLLREGFQMSGYVKYDEIISIIGGCIAYVQGFLLHSFLTYRLLVTFKGSVYEMLKCKLVGLIAILFLNMICGMWLVLTWKIIENWKIETQIIINILYKVIQLLINISILFAFNSRLYRLILSCPNEVGNVTVMIKITMHPTNVLQNRNGYLKSSDVIL